MWAIQPQLGDLNSRRHKHDESCLLSKRLLPVIQELHWDATAAFLARIRIDLGKLVVL